MTNLRLIVIVALLVAVRDSSQAKNPKNQFYRSFKCHEGHDCRRTSAPLASIDPDYLEEKNEHTTLAACRLVCGDYGALWPIPTNVTIYGRKYLKMDPTKIWFDTDSSPDSTVKFITNAGNAFIQRLQSSCQGPCESVNATTRIRIIVARSNPTLDWNTNEKYTIDVFGHFDKGNHGMTILAQSIYGVLHAFETLQQLTAPVVTPGGGSGLVIINRAYLHDAPAFPHRGLLIDTARNFLPVPKILETVRAMAATKMNVLHWHATDSQSFPLHIPRRPLMSHYGAYAPDKVYRPADLKRVVDYARARGVRVILELDSPSHVGAGWEWGPSEGLGKIAVCVNRQPWREYCIQPPCGQINPVNPNAYDVLRDIYRDVLGSMGADSMIHLGGDEVYINCWNATPEVTAEMTARGMGRRTEDFLQLWGEFHTAQAKILDEVKQGRGDSAILWSSALTSPEVIERHLDKEKFVIQTWVEASSEMPGELLKLGYRLIMSTKNAWYLDHGFWGKTQYHSWRDAYNNRLPSHEGILGGEACMWGEYVNEGGLDARIWPRAAAVAERLWSNPLDGSTARAEPRLQAHISRLKARGIFADALAPEWCAQHEGMCL